MAQVDYTAYTASSGDGVSTGKFKDFLRSWGGNLRAFAQQLQDDHNALDTTVSGKIGTTWTTNVNAGGFSITNYPSGVPAADDYLASWGRIKTYVNAQVSGAVLLNLSSQKT